MAGEAVTADATRSIAQAVAVVFDTPIPCTRGVYVGTTGNLSCVMTRNQATIVFPNVPVGWFQVQVTQINSASTTIVAGQLFAGY